MQNVFGSKLAFGLIAAVASVAASAVPVAVTRNNSLGGSFAQVSAGQAYEFSIDFHLYPLTTGFKATQSMAVGNASNRDSTLTGWITGPSGFFQSMTLSNSPSSQRLLGKDDSMAEGDYTLHVKGTAKTSLSITYGVSVLTPDTAPIFTPPISNVPEPETYAMMLAGLGAIGFLARRRQSV